MSAPKCAVHRGGRADPDGCVAPLPAFWLCDSVSAPRGECIQVMGWASNYAQIYDALRVYARDRTAQHVDTYWGMPLPNPIPAPGAEVTVQGQYSEVFTKLATGWSRDLVMGILTYSGMRQHRPAPTPARLPR